jgi:hypothetical protein
MKNIEYMILKKLFELKKLNKYNNEAVDTLERLIISEVASEELNRFSFFNWEEIRNEDLMASEFVHR